MQKPLIYSVSLHFTAIALMILGLPPSDRNLEIPDSIPVELVSMGEVTEAARVDEGEESPDPPAPPPPAAKPTPPQPPAPPPPERVEPTPPPPPKAPEPPKLAQTPPPPREPAPPPPPPKAPEPPKPEPPKPEPPKPAPTPEPTPKVEPPKPEPKKPEPPKPEPPKPEPPKPEPPKPPEPKKPEPPKPEPPKPEPPKQEPKKPPPPPEDPLAKLLGDVAKMKPAPSQPQTSSAAKPSQNQSTAKPSGAKTATPGPEREFKPSGRATDAIRSQLSKLWNVDTGRRSDGDMKVVIHVEVGPDGSVLNARMDDASLARASSDRAYRASAEAAVRAVLRAQKLNLLPDEFTPATYQNWRKFVFTFDPRDMF